MPEQSEVIDINKVIEQQRGVLSLAVALGVIPDDGSNVQYTKELGQNVRSELTEALSNVRVRHGRSTIRPDNPDDVLAGRLATKLANSDTFSGSNYSKDEIQELLTGAIKNIDNSITSLNAAVDYQQPYNQISFLSQALGGKPIPDSGYTPEYGAEVLALRDARLADAADWAAQTAKSPAAPISAEDALVASIRQEAAMSGVDVDPKTLKNLIVNAPITVGKLNHQTQPQAGVSVAPEANPSTGETITKIVPDDRILRVEQALSTLIENFNEDGANLATPKVDGVFEENDIASFNKALAYLKAKAGLDEKFPENGYSKELGDALEGKILLKLNAELLAKNPTAFFISTANASSTSEETAEIQKTIKAVPELFKDLDALYDDGKLVAVNLPNSNTPAANATSNQNSSPEPKTPTSSGNDSSSNTTGSSDQSQEDLTREKFKPVVKIVENFLYQIGDIEKIPGVGEAVKKFGGKDIADSLFTPLEESEIDGNFGAHEQDLTSKLIMAMKMVDEQPVVDGTYNKAIGDRLKLSILTKPGFSFVRDMDVDGKPLGIKFYGDSKENIELARQLLDFKEMSKPGEGASKEDLAAYKLNQEFKAKHAQELESIKGINTLFNSIEVLTKANIYDNKKAKEVNQNNMMIDLLSTGMDNFAPGLKSWLKDFFQGDGKWLADLLVVFTGIDISRLWGEKNNDADPIATAIKSVNDKFDSNFAEVAKTLPADASFEEKLAAANAKFLDDFDSWKVNTALWATLDAEDRAAFKAAVNGAVKATENTHSMEEAKIAFNSKIQEFREQFTENNQGVTPRSFARQAEEMANNAKSATGELERHGNISPDSKAATSAKAAPADDSSAIAVAGTQIIALEYVPDTNDYDQDPMRFSEGRVGEMQEGLTNAYLELDLSINSNFMKKDDGEFTDTLNRGSCAIVEELLIRAQIHDITEGGKKPISEDAIKGLERRVTLDNLDTIEAYMIDKGVSQTNIDLVVDNISDMLTDFRSTKPDSEQTISVWEQSQLTNQIKLEISQADPQPSAQKEPIAQTVKEKEPEAEKKEPCDEDKPNLGNDFRAAVPYEHKIPTSFDELRSLNEYGRFKDLYEFVGQEFADKGISNNIYSTMEDSFTRNSQYTILNLKDFGIEDPRIDAVVALRHNGKTHFAFVDYETDHIKAMDLQGKQGFDDMDLRDDYHTRRLDDVLSVIKRTDGHGIIQAPVGGYASMLMMKPNLDNNGTTTINAMEGIYGQKAVDPRHPGAQEAMGRYFDANTIYYPENERKVAQNSGYNNGGYNNGNPERETQHNAPPPPPRDSNACHKGGPFSDFGEKGPPVIGFLFNNIGDIIGKAIGEFDCDNSNSQRSREIHGNMHDVTGRPAANGPSYYGDDYTDLGISPAFGTTPAGR